MNSVPYAVKQTIQDLLFNPDPEKRQRAAELLGERELRPANEADALEALTTAIHDRHMLVQETALQSLVRLGR